MSIKKSFGFHADSADIFRWRAYARSKIGSSQEQIYTDAINEYIHNHPLTGQEYEYFHHVMNFYYSAEPSLSSEDDDDGFF